MSNGRDSTRKLAIFTQFCVLPRFRDDRLDLPPLNGFDARGSGSISPPHPLSTSQFDHHCK